MKIIIAGAGDVGFHLAQLLVKENQDITLIDTDESVLDYAGTHLDVITIRGDASSNEVLDQAEVQKCDLFLAVTTSGKTNLLTAIIARKMGAKKTIARVDNPEYLQPIQRGQFLELGVDHLISPRQLAALEIERLLQRCTATDVFDFEDGKISIIGFTVDNTSKLNGKSLKEINDASPNFLFRGIALLRKHKTIIPDDDTILQREDHLYLVTRKEHLDTLTTFAGKTLKAIKKVMIVGGSPLALHTAKLLENNYSVSLVEKSREECKNLVEKLQNTLVINADPSNVELLREEGLEEMDAFVALSPNSETNIITSLMAEELGVYKTIALVDNSDYTRISQNIGVDTLINKKIIAANNIFRFVRKGKIEAIMSLHGVDAEIIEFAIHKQNRLTKHKLRDLHFPKEAIIAGVVRGEESFIPNGDFELQIEDKVIVFALEEAISRVEEIFR